jgi:flagellar biosynthetic protein FliR
MTFTVSTAWLNGFLLALARASAWTVITPPFRTLAIPVRVRIALAVALSLAIAPQLAPDVADFSATGLVTSVVAQVAVGLALGFVVMLLLAAVQAAGHIIDVLAGFGLASIYDPMSGAASSPFGRLYELLATVLLFAVNGHVVLVRGFLRSFEAIPATSLDLGALAELLTNGLSSMLIAAMQIALPLGAALFVADIALGLLGRAAPRINVLVLGLGAKALIALLVAGLALPLLPAAVRSLTDRSLSLTGLGG